MHHRRAAVAALGTLLAVLVGSAFVADRLPSADGQPGALPPAGGPPGATIVVSAGLVMAPGVVVTRTVTLPQLQPDALRYRVTLDVQPAGDPLASQLILSVSTLGSSCEQHDGTFLFRGRALQVVVDANVLGLNRGAIGALCLGVELPLDAGNASQGRTVSVQLSVAAE